MTVDLVTLIVPGMATTIATLATIMWRREVARGNKLEKQNETLVSIMIARAAKSDETVKEFADYLKRNEGS